MPDATTVQTILYWEGNLLERQSRYWPPGRTHWTFTCGVADCQAGLDCLVNLRGSARRALRRHYAKAHPRGVN